MKLQPYTNLCVLVFGWQPESDPVRTEMGFNTNSTAEVVWIATTNAHDVANAILGIEDEKLGLEASCFGIDPRIASHFTVRYDSRFYDSPIKARNDVLDVIVRVNKRPRHIRPTAYPAGYVRR